MDTLTFDLTKKEHFYELKPYGKFTIKFNTKQGYKPNIIPLVELQFDSNKTMPVDDVLDKKIIKLMLKYHTDILIDDNGDFYTRIGVGFGKVYHKKLALYKNDEAFKELVDSNV